MPNQLFKFELKGKIIFSKILKPDETLNQTRKKISKRINSFFVFLDKEKNVIDQEDEENYNIGLINDGEIIRVQNSISSTSNSSTNDSNINVILNGKNICSINCTKDNSLTIVRNLINNLYKEDFIFYDSDNNYIEKDDEDDYMLENILNNNEIKIKKNSQSKDASPPKPIKKENKFITKKDETINSKKNKIINFSKYDVIKNIDDFIIYKYSNIKPHSPKELVYQYFFDSYEANDYDTAYIVLFCGKTGEGKTTAINAFFNIVKGIELEDNYRFILITEPKKAKGQAESQTDGVHLYYLKDYNNKPIIIIDSQGYGDTRGLPYDQKITVAFEYVFSNVINHINTVCFISKSNNNRIDICTKYIFSSVTSLFADDITENFIVVPTFADKETIKEGPQFIESIKSDAEFLKLDERKDRWWYALDSKCMLDNDTDKITKYSFQSMKDLYEQKIKKLPSKSIKKSAEVLITRGKLRIQVNLLYDTFQTLMMEQGNLQLKVKALDEISAKIFDMETRIKNFKNEAKSLNPAQLEIKLRDLNQELNDKLNNLNCEVEEQFVSSCEYGGDDYKYNHCDYCKRNCHDVCDCNFNGLGRCTKFSWGIIGDKKCEECNCIKERHRIDHYHWVKKRISIKKDNTSRIEEERRRNDQERQRYLEEINQKKKSKNELDRQLNELNFNREKLIVEKEKNMNEKNEIEKKILTTSNNITFIIIKLKNMSDKIDCLAMNTENIKTEDEYIDSLKRKMDEIGYNDEEQIKAMDSIKKQNKIYTEIKNKQNLNDEELADLLGVKMPSNKEK